MWAYPRTFFWPLHGLSFARDHTDYTGLEYLWKMLEQSFHPGFSGIHTPEIMGIGILVLMSLYWLKRKLDKKNSEDVTSLNE
jgi:hypothetical protein